MKTSKLRLWLLLPVFLALLAAPRAQAQALQSPGSFASLTAQEKTLQPPDGFASLTAQLPETFATAETTAVSTLKKRAFRARIYTEHYEKKILQGDTHTLTLDALPEGYTVEFSSSAPSILSVKQISPVSCQYTGIGYGTAKIQATVTQESGLFFFDESKTKNFKVRVSPRAVSIKFNKSFRKLFVGDSIKPRLTIRPSISKEKPVFQSSRQRVVSVTTNGRITALRPGTAYITATISNGKSAKCKICVHREREEF